MIFKTIKYSALAAILSAMSVTAIAQGAAGVAGVASSSAVRTDPGQHAKDSETHPDTTIPLDTAGNEPAEQRHLRYYILHNYGAPTWRMARSLYPQPPQF